MRLDADRFGTSDDDYNVFQRPAPTGNGKKDGYGTFSIFNGKTLSFLMVFLSVLYALCGIKSFMADFVGLVANYENGKKDGYGIF